MNNNEYILLKLNRTHLFRFSTRSSTKKRSHFYTVHSGTLGRFDLFANPGLRKSKKLFKRKKKEKEKTKKREEKGKMDAFLRSF